MILSRSQIVDRPQLMKSPAMPTKVVTIFPNAPAIVTIVLEAQ